MADDRSVGQQSVFDWGKESCGGGNDRSIASGDTSTKEGPSSRYDPKAMSRIVDINDLVDDSGDDSDDDDQIVGHSSSSGGINAKGKGAGSVGAAAKRRKSGNMLGYGPGGIGSGMMMRQILILTALVAIIVGASMAIGLAIVNSNEPGNNKGASNTQNLMGTPNKMTEDTRNQQLLEIAERVIMECSESKLDEDMSGCQKLCKKNMCCFESGKYGCEDDEKKNCAVYAGCANLMEGVPLDAAEEDEQ